MGQGPTSPGYSILKLQTTTKSYFYQSIKVKCVQERSDENRVSQNSNFNQNQYLYQYSKLYRVQISVTRVQFQVRVMEMKNVPNFEKISTFIQIFVLTLFRNYEVSRMKRYLNFQVSTSKTPVFLKSIELRVFRVKKGVQFQGSKR